MKRSAYKTLPETPGVYLMKDSDGKILYVGKAGNLRRRVSSYFERPHDVRIEALVRKIETIDFRRTDTALEALILEAELIKKLTPPFNVREKDDKSFLWVEITREKFPRVMLVRGNRIHLKSRPEPVVSDFQAKTANADDGLAELMRGGIRRLQPKITARGPDILRKATFEMDSETGNGRLFGPFTSASSARGALKVLRRIFPWNSHVQNTIGTFERPCFDYEIGLCPGTCVNKISRDDYLKNIARLKLFFEGKKKEVIRSIEKEMGAASKVLDFERAEKLRNQLFALKHIRDTALIGDAEVASRIQDPGSDKKNYRIEGYDISNISGTSAVGSMVVFENGEPNKAEYRKFRIKTVFGPNDVGMITEVLERRFKHSEMDNRESPIRDAASDVEDGRSYTLHTTPQTPSWPLPDLILIDGGLAQANAAKKVFVRAGLRIPIVSIAKGPERKRNDIIGAIPKGVAKATLVRVRDEAHRFAISYHKKLRSIRSLS